MQCFFFSFLNYSFTKKALTLISELDETLIYTLVKFKYQSSSFKIYEYLKKTKMISCLCKTTFLAGSQVCWNVISLEEGNWLIFLPKDHKHNRHQRGVEKIWQWWLWWWWWWWWGFWWWRWWLWCVFFFPKDLKLFF